MQAVRCTVESPIGAVTLVASNGALVGLYPATHRRIHTVSQTVETGSDPVFKLVCTQLTEYFAGTRQAFNLPLEMDGTPFERSVWKILQSIPLGETRTYGQIATMLGDPNLSRAVGAANGANPISIIVPCHRVVGSAGLTGYAGGIEMKEFLLQHEGALSQASLF